MSAGRKRVRVQGFEIPTGEIIGLIRWFPLEGNGSTNSSPAPSTASTRTAGSN